MATKAQMQVEIDRLTVELMRYNGIDVDGAERLQTERDRAVGRAARLSRVIHLLCEANEFSIKAEEARSAAMQLCLDHAEKSRHD